MFHVPELTDQVIDHLHADPDALRACALVSSSWTPASQFHIFFSVNIHHNTACRLLCELISHSPHIESYVRNIYVYFESTRPTFDALADLRLPELRRLSIVNCPHTDELAQIRHLIQLPLLTEFRFFSGTTVGLAQLEFLAANRSRPLRSLLLYSASDTPAQEAWEPAPEYSRKALDISYLNVGGEVTGVTDILGDEQGPIGLRNIDWLTFDSDNAPCLPRLLKLCGEKLTRLQVRMSGPQWLACNAQIESGALPLLTYLDLHSIDMPANLPSVFALLSTLRKGSSLRTLRLTGDTLNNSFTSYTLDRRVAHDRTLWIAIDGILDDIPSLVSLTFGDTWSILEQGWGLRFVDCFPNMLRKRILVAPPGGSVEPENIPLPPSPLGIEDVPLENI
ncbi:hypothetical protein C8J57DRAFT_1407710 [Mycena rebaudengoi]|nr:hypothetical protein C8J57DRAFT_1407710 [Mycena rebaudengoi]